LNNYRPLVWFRVNSLLWNADSFKEYCDENRLEYDQFDADDNYFCVKESGFVLASHLMPEGKLTVQNPAGGLVIKLLKPEKDEIVIDGCSAPGGKSTLIAEMMGNSGQILAYDTDIGRLQKVSENAARMKIDNINCYQKDLTVDLLPKADKILLDVPCSGTGVMTKRADLRWRRTPQEIEEFSRLQSKILKHSAGFMTKGSILVYSTCTLESEENWQVIDQFLSSDGFELEPASDFVPESYTDEKGALFTFPPSHKIDGGFAVRLRKR